MSINYTASKIQERKIRIVSLEMQKRIDELTKENNRLRHLMKVDKDIYHSRALKTMRQLRKAIANIRCHCVDDHKCVSCIVRDWQNGNPIEKEDL